ncbi:MAG TPA: SDR family oxidoreductase [Gaiellaceae bacterium]|jgi:NAD(P)-dependent dehydrogenase (short-subunit alcohol dehydrogenase family)|nr:SDR family oxidoreductase [Gaiellaceae bacterium]
MASSLHAALVTGGTGRVGKAVAARLETEGHRVLAAGRSDGDLRRAGEAHALVERAAAQLGGLDVVVCAAAAGFAPRAVDDVAEEDWELALDTTAKGTFFTLQAAAPWLRRSEVGLAVVIEDVAAYEAWPRFGPHCAAKAAQAMLTRVFARALAPDVRVCGIAPGTVAAEPGQEERRAAESLLGRVGSPQDVANAVAFLLRAEFVTGTTLVVDGGRLAKP